MRIASIRIENFRSFADATIPFNDYACLVGPNGAGKSTVLSALSIFFRESENLPTDLSQLEQEDFHCKDTAEPVKITLTFCDLTDQAREDFADYVRQDQLVVSAVATFDAAAGKAQVKQYGQRLGMRALAPFFEAVKGGQESSGTERDIFRTASDLYRLASGRHQGSHDAGPSRVRSESAERMRAFTE